MTDIDSLIQLAKERITKLSTKILNAKSNDESYGFMAKQEIHYFWLSKLKELKSEIEDAPLLDGWVRVEDAKKMIVEFGDILLGDYEMSTCVDETGENVVCWILCGTEQKSDSNKLLESLIKEKYFPKLKELKQSLPQTGAGNQDGWISVEERLPECGKMVITFPFSMITIRHTKKDEDGDTRWFFDALPVTHWQPLPPPPKGIEP